MHQAVHDLVQTEAVPQFGKTVTTWTHKPTFTAQETPRGWGINVTPDFPWRWVDEGTRKGYKIPKTPRPYPLRWQGPYHAKTKINVIASYKGGRGRVWVSKWQVTHPGIEARNFRDIILKRIQTRAAGYVRDKLNQASYGAGQGL